MPSILDTTFCNKQQQEHSTKCYAALTNTAQLQSRVGDQQNEQENEHPWTVNHKPHEVSHD